ncbi:hypothetical protein MMC11_004461 [Xylographa trunciseda]|nr:hypothetical protein [Xylographa trunciseda]
MDHLPIPDHYRGNMIAVPYLGLAPEYDELGFEGFPERHGLSTESLQNGNFDQYRAQGSEWLESFLQEWLFFGILHEFSKICDVPLQLTDFVYTNAKKERIITTRPLLSYARRAVQELVISLLIKGNKNIERKDIREKCLQIPLSGLSRLLVNWTTAFSDGTLTHCRVEVSSLLAALHRVSQSFSMIMSRAIRILELAGQRGWPAIRISLSLSIGVLCESLQWFALNCLAKQRDSISIVPLIVYFREYLKKQGWCPNRSSKVLLSVGACLTMSYLPSYDIRSHSRCDRNACLEPSKRLETQHNVSCDGHCEHTHFDDQDLVQILRNGGNPGIMMCTTKLNAISYKLVDAFSYPFIAISHVWSHGLGNPSSNSLPNCQVSRLFALIAKLPQPHEGGDLVLWIDTLCVPISPQHKYLGILKLREVYATASKVLVVDVNLMRVGTNWLERRLQFICSEWSRRLWTLQEGRLASALYIQYKDEAVDVKDLWQQEQPKDITTENDLLSNMNQIAQFSIKSDFNSASEQGVHFAHLINDLAYRSTTEAKDEPICIGTLLGVQLEDFGGTPTMVDIYRSCRSIPVDVIFTLGPRLKLDGFGWAPSTFLNRGSPLVPSFNRDGMLTPIGFKFGKPGIQFSDNFELYYRKNVIYSMCFNDGNIACTFVPVRFKEYEDEFGLAPKRLSRPAIILENSKEQPSLYNRGALVSEVEYDVDRQTFNCKFEIVVYMEHWTEETASKREATFQGWKHILLKGSLERDRTWCIR